MSATLIAAVRALVPAIEAPSVRMADDGKSGHFVATVAGKMRCVWFERTAPAVVYMPNMVTATWLTDEQLAKVIAQGLK